MVSSDGIKPCFRNRERIRFNLILLFLSALRSSSFALVANWTTRIFREVGEEVRGAKRFLEQVGPVRDATALEKQLVSAAAGSPLLPRQNS